MVIIVMVVIAITIVVIMGVEFCGDRGCAQNLGDKTRPPHANRGHMSLSIRTSLCVRSTVLAYVFFVKSCEFISYLTTGKLRHAP